MKSPPEVHPCFPASHVKGPAVCGTALSEQANDYLHYNLPGTLTERLYTSQAKSSSEKTIMIRKSLIMVIIGQEIYITQFWSLLL